MTRTPTPESFLDFKIVSDPQITPDGESVAFTVSEPLIHDTALPRSSVWLVPTDGGSPRRLTADGATSYAPRWSPDGHTLALISDREHDGQPQLYLMPRRFGEAVRLTGMRGGVFGGARGVNPMAWSPDGSKIAFMADDPIAEGDKRRGLRSQDPVEFEQSPSYTRLYTIDAATGEVECISPSGLQVWEFAWSNDGSRFAASVTDLPFESDWYLCRLAVFEPGGPATTLYDEERAVSAPSWSPDDSHIAFTSSHWSDKYAQRGGVFVVPSGGGGHREITESHRATYGWIRWAEGGRELLLSGSLGSQYGLVRVDLDSGGHETAWSEPCTFGEASYPALTVDGAGRIAVVKEDSDNPRDVWLATPQDGGYAMKRLTNMNPHASELDIGITEEIFYEGADGWEMQAFLTRPHNAPSDRPLPMVLDIHGGPSGAHQNSYAPASPYNHAEALAAIGYAVLKPNPRGSNGWGLDFTESNLGDQGGKDWEDIMLGVDYCVEQGIADPDRLGVTGNSYGGYMTMWAVTQTGRFKAAVAGMGISEWRSFHGATEIENWNTIYYAHEDQYDPDGKYRTFAPLVHIDNVTTPTLVLHGEVDHVCPVHQARQFHRALKDKGIEVSLCVYPREPHGWREREHMRDIAHRTVQWLADRV